MFAVIYSQSPNTENNSNAYHLVNQWYMQQCVYQEHYAKWKKLVSEITCYNILHVFMTFCKKSKLQEREQTSSCQGQREAGRVD